MIKDVKHILTKDVGYDKGCKAYIDITDKSVVWSMICAMAKAEHEVLS